MAARKPKRRTPTKPIKGSVWRGKPPGPEKSLDGAVVVEADSLAFLRALRDESADLVFLDPPSIWASLTVVREPAMTASPRVTTFASSAAYLRSAFTSSAPAAHSSCTTSPAGQSDSLLFFNDSLCFDIGSPLR